MTSLETRVRAALDVLCPPLGDVPPSWDDALRRGGVGGGARRRRLAAATALAAGVLGVLAVSAFGSALVGGTWDRLAAWVGASPGEPAPAAEQSALESESQRAAAPVPEGTKIGLLQRGTFGGDTFELLGFRDRSSFCLRLRHGGTGGDLIRKAPADCVSQRLLAALGKPIAVLAAANPFSGSGNGIVALYGLAADGVRAVELDGPGGRARVPVRNNTFLYLYSGRPPRLTEAGRLDYPTPVPTSVTAITQSGRGPAVPIATLKRGEPDPPPPAAVPGPFLIERPLFAGRVRWLEDGEERGSPFTLPHGGSTFPGPRLIHPSNEMSLRVVVGVVEAGAAPERMLCRGALWPLERVPSGLLCSPASRSLEDTIALAEATTMLEAQLPVYYGIVADGVESLDLFLENGARLSVPIVDNVFAVQVPAVLDAKLVAYDAAGRVVGIRMV